MKCKAKHWVKYNGAWHRAGEEFRISPLDADEMKIHGDLTEEAEDAEPEDETEAQEPAKRGRKRKAETPEE